MKKALKDIYINIFGSLKNDTSGYSSKKLTAFAIVICIVMAHIKWMNTKDFSLLPTILGLDFGFITLLFGINVADKKINPSEKTLNDNQ